MTKIRVWCAKHEVDLESGESVLFLTMRLGPSENGWYELDLSECFCPESYEPDECGDKWEVLVK
jgi:hypothetical protein